MKLRQRILLATLAAFALTISGCGGSSSTPPPPATPTVTLSGQPSSLTTGTTASITATVSNSSGVTWTVTCATAPCGSFNPATTASGAATVYTAPAAATSVTITATTSTGTTAAASATISITAPVLTVAFNPAAPTSIKAGATSNLTAVVTNDPQNKGVTWSCTPASSCGSFNPTSTASGTATVYTAPSSVPTSGTVIVTATSVTDTTKTASATITIGAPPPVLADGTYVYHFSGWDNSGPTFFAGAFTVSGGAITGGEQDFSDASIGYPNVALAPANCSLSTAGNNIQVVLGLANNTSIGVNGVETLRGTVVSSSRVLINEFDTFGTGNGSIDLQTTPVAPLSGGYAFVVSGWDINASNPNSPVFTQLAIGGILNFSGTSLSITSSVFDFNFGAYGTTTGPQVGQALLFTSGSVNGPDSFGRVSITLTPTSTSGVPAFILTGYIVSPNQIQLVESQTDTLSDDLGGVALGQGSNASKFALSSLAGTTYVFASSGEDVAGEATFGGNLSFSTSGAISGNLAVNDGTNFTTAPTSITGGSYTVDLTGRATLSNILTSQFGTSAFAFQLYLDGNGNALQMGADTLENVAGPAYHKTATSNDFEGPYALSGSGILNDANLDGWGAVGPVTVASDNLTGAADYNAQGLTTPVSATPVTATENNSAGTLSVTGLDSTSFTTSRLYSYFPIDGKRVFAIETDGAQLGIITLESTSH